MIVNSRIYANLYKDSVSLMTVSARIMATAGIETASVVMATAANVENLASAGLGEFDVRPNDLIVAVAGSDAACASALATADHLLSANERPGALSVPGREAPLPSIHLAVVRDPATTLALISVPGDYAAAEALKALDQGLDVMIFSDNVPIAQERQLKEHAEARGLMVMGPDCGTAIVNGIPLGFANVVRRGPIGVVGASGTGTQEVTVRIHQAGSGVSQALGTGGHDLSDAIGGISMLHGLRALKDDPATKVIVLVSKPPSPDVSAKVLDAAAAGQKPVVAVFLGADPDTVSRPGVTPAATLAEAADLAVGLVSEGPARVAGTGGPAPSDPDLIAIARTLSAGQTDVRGIFCGGTFCYEAQLIHVAAGFTGRSNAPVAGNGTLVDVAQSQGHSFLDMGDDAFTKGRPHPMIDPSLRDTRIRQDAADPATAVVLFDVVLGYGAADDPVSGLVTAIERARTEARDRGRTPVFIGHVCGTDEDPQDRVAALLALRSAGVLIASSNAEAARWSAGILSARRGAVS